MTTYFVYDTRPYGAGEGNPNGVPLKGDIEGAYWARRFKAETAGGEPCVICGRKVNTKRASHCIVDVEDATFTARTVRLSGSENDLRLSFVGPECHAKHVVGSFEVRDANKAAKMAAAMAEARKDLAEMKADAATGRVVSLPPTTVGLGGNVKGCS